MAAAYQPQLVFVDGTTAELAQELANYVKVGDEVKPLLEKGNEAEALAAIVRASSALNAVPEREFGPAYNLLVYLVLESADPKKLLPTVCQNITKPVTSSPANGPGLALNALQTIFNVLKPDSPLRFNVFTEIVRFAKTNSLYDNLRPALVNLPHWFSTWQSSPEDQRRLLVDVADLAAEAGEEEESYNYVLKALLTFDADKQEQLASDEAHKLSLRALRIAILSPTRFDFQDLRILPAVQALSDSHPVYYQLLEIFAEQDLEDFKDFNEEHDGFLEKEKLDEERLVRKIRLLTFASLAASTPSKELEYASIAKALQIPAEDVEMWTIDVIRAKLVEGKLSQKKRVVLIHRTIYRVFGEKQWRELGTRLDQWKTVLGNVHDVLRRQQAEAEAAKEREQQELERKLQNAGFEGNQGGQRRGGKGQYQNRDQQQARNDNDD